MKARLLIEISWFLILQKSWCLMTMSYKLKFMRTGTFLQSQCFYTFSRFSNTLSGLNRHWFPGESFVRGDKMTYHWDVGILKTWWIWKTSVRSKITQATMAITPKLGIQQTQKSSQWYPTCNWETMNNFCSLIDCKDQIPSQSNAWADDSDDTTAGYFKVTEN